MEMAHPGGDPMFESSSSRSGTHVNRCLVAVTHADGTTANFSVRLPLSGKINDALNNSDQFLDVITGDGEQLFIAKRDIRQLKLVDVPKLNQLNFYRRASDKGAFDPYQVLKVEKGARLDEIKQSYHRLAKLYHPDRIGGFELPDEVHEYARVMLVRINLAYEQIGH